LAKGEICPSFARKWAVKYCPRSSRPLAFAAYKPLIYDEIILLVSQGSFVATHCMASWVSQSLAQIAIFRIESGLVVEHWDNSETVPPENEWANSSKF